MLFSGELGNGKSSEYRITIDQLHTAFWEGRRVRVVTSARLSPNAFLIPFPISALLGSKNNVGNGTSLHIKHLRMPTT